MLEALLKQVDLSKVIVPREAFRPIPGYEDRERWQALPPDVKAYFHGAASMIAGTGWPELPASWYMDFYRNGNRTRFQEPFMKRRVRLYILLIAECIEGQGRLIDDIINGIWAICEESTWVLPTHISWPEHPELPRVPLMDWADPMIQIDLTSAETASLLSWVWVLLGERLSKASPIVARRILWEIDRRILTPYLQNDSYFWMGLHSDRRMNNWCIWITSNIFAAAMNVEPDPVRRAAIAQRACQSTQRFIDSNEEDGGCDEGSGYFAFAGASLLDMLETLDIATQGAVQLYDKAQIRNTGKFIMHMHIGKTWYVNFADAGAHFRPDAMQLLRVGEKTKQPDLVAFAKSCLREGTAQSPYAVGVEAVTIFRRLMDLFEYDPAVFADAPPYESQGIYLPSIETATARGIPGEGRELFLAAKANHNGESHGHNDVGGYILAVDGEPVIIDAGVETYTKETFGPNRYRIWTMMSSFHNTAILNGTDQREGSMYAASDVRYEASDGRVTFSMDMAGAYPKEAGVTHYRRTFTFMRRENTLTCKDEAVFGATVQPTVLPLMTRVQPEDSAGVLRFSAGNHALVLEYDDTLFSVEVEPLALKDEKLRRIWRQDAIYRVLLIRKEMRMEDAYTLRYSVR